MKVIKKILLGCLMMVLISFSVETVFHVSIISQTATAHSGRTDSSGGHKDNKNKSGLGSYHYHCGGYPAHLHKNGVCPYSTSSTEKSSSTSSNNSSQSKTSKETVKKVQTALNDLGYDCGTADGVLGSKSKTALKKYQKDKKLTVDGVIGNEVINSLGINK